MKLKKYGSGTLFVSYRNILTVHLSQQKGKGSLQRVRRAGIPAFVLAQGCEGIYVFAEATTRWTLATLERRDLACRIVVACVLAFLENASGVVRERGGDALSLFVDSRHTAACCDNAR
jgi:hypothetical protein